MVSAAAQSSRPAELKFEVASVKRNDSGDSSIDFQVQPGGRFVATNIPLKQFIRAAYRLQLYQIVDAPSIFAALPEQIGLRLEPCRSRQKVLVVESIDRPAPD